MVTQLGIEPMTMTTRCLVVALATKLLGQLGAYGSRTRLNGASEALSRVTCSITITSDGGGCELHGGIYLVFMLAGRYW